MSLATFLLGSKSPSGKKKVIDAELDALFQSPTAEDLERSEPTSNDSPAEKRKKRRSNVHADEPHKKRSKPSLPNVPSSSASSHGKQKKSSEERVLIASKPTSVHVSPDLEQPESSKNLSLDKPGSEISDEDENQDSVLVHETVQREKPRKPETRKEKYSPSDETKERRDARTIFIGNLAPEVAIRRPLQKQLHRHILLFVPAAKIESIRFRSVPFQTPTSKLPGTNDEEQSKQPRQHEQDRASSWRDTHTAGASKSDEKKFLTPSQKKKIAFINKDIHADADSVHAYIVFAYPPPAHSRPTNLPPLTPVMDPFEATRLAIEKCSGTMFLDRMLRVDAVVKRSTTESPSENLLPNSVGDPKLTVFVGNLDFASKEEDLRAFFEGVVSAERGPPASEGLQDGDKQKSWVTRVRMIRDKDTQLGKGFAYVQFSDRACIDEILAFEHGKLKFAKRKLRVQRCKTIPGTSSIKNTPPEFAKKSDRTPVPLVPKGDPSLGGKLANLTKDERKRIKGADADRVARRMAKKKARMALAKQGVPVQSKQRERIRKTSAAKKHGRMPPKKSSKGRVKSEKSVAKMNTKK